MAYKHILTEMEEGVLTVTINREDKMNALNLEVLYELNTIFNGVNKDKEIKGVIITGAGQKAFVAGADIAEFADFDEDEGKAMSEDGHNTFNKIENCKKPVIAAVNGFALGGGCELAMACHLRVAAENAKFGQPEVTLGLIPGYGGTQRLVQLVGKGKALELMMTGDMVNAQEAYQLKLVNHVVPQEELLKFSKSILKKIFSKAPFAVSHVIECVNAYYNDREHGFEREIDLFAECFETEDFREGTNAFIGKRKPEFKGK